MKCKGRPTAVVAIGALLSCYPVELSAQQEQGRQCTRCTIERVEYARLGTAGDAELMSITSTVARDSRGRFYATAFDGGCVIAFDASGKFLSTVGRRGDGPGEFRRIAVIGVGPGDTLYVRERGGGVSVFSPDYKFVRQRPLDRSGSSAMLPLGSGRIVAGLTPRSDRDPIMAIVNYGDEWQGAGVGRDPLGCSECALRTFAYRDARSFWAASLYSYRLELWDTSGRLEKEVRPRAPWLSAAQFVRPSPDSKPASRINAIAADGRGSLWVFGYTPTEDYRPSAVAGSITLGGRQYTVVSPQDAEAARAASLPYTITVLDVVNPDSGEIIATARYRGQYLLKVDGLTGDLAGTLAYTTESGSDGVPIVRVWHLRLKPS